MEALMSDNNSIVHSAGLTCDARNYFDAFVSFISTKHCDLAREEDSASALSGIKIELRSSCDDVCMDNIDDAADSCGSNVVTVPGIISLV